MDKLRDFLQLVLHADELLKWGGYPALMLIVFAETGLLIGFFLPGDSLLVTAGVFVQANLMNPLGLDPFLNLLVMNVALMAMAIIGDAIGFSIGYRAGPMIFSRKQSFFFRKDHLDATQAFYEKHGGKTIIIARFIPIIRTFAPVVAGIGRMDYKRFLMFNIAGGISWICSMMLLGYTLHLWAEPLVNWVGRQLGLQFHFKVERNIDSIVVLIVLISVVPLAWKFLMQRLNRRKAVTEAVK